MLIPTRSYQSPAYRYGFQGQEKDDEIKGNGNSYSTFFRQYDSRISRWLSIDPKMSKYPNLSPYISYNNNPIFYTDPFGDDPPERLGFWSRVGNWLKGESHKNRANKMAAEQGLELYSTFDGNVQIVSNIKTRESTSFVSKELRTDFLLQFLEETTTVDFDIQFMRPEQMLLNIIQDNGGFTGLLFDDLAVNLGTVQVGYLNTVQFYDDVSGTEEDDPMVAQISITSSNIQKARFRLRWGRLAGNKNTVYMRFKKMTSGPFKGQRLPYIGKSFNVLNRYTKSIASSSRLKNIVSGISDKNVLRAVEQRMIDYVKSKASNIGNVRNAMNSKDYKKYANQVEKLLKGTNWQKYIDDYFGF